MRRQAKKRFAVVALASAVALATGCGDAADTAHEVDTPTGSASDTAANGTAGGDIASPDDADGDLVTRGERIYNVNCIACHHRDPAQDGGLGPPVAGSARELLEARVMRGEYPAGYTPKADTRLMIPLPHLEPELDALAAFLESRAN